MRIGLIGAGAIAEFLLTEINQKKDRDLTITDIYVRNKEKYEHLEKEFNLVLHTDIQSFLDTEIDIVVEAATVEAVKDLLPAVVKKKDVILISVGALVDEALLADIREEAESYGNTVHLPSGAIGGLDLLQNAHALDAVSRVTLTTRKPAHSLTDEELTQEKVIFNGKAKDAIKQFPKNINVSIVLSLAGLGIEETTVRLIADPELDKNIHQIDAAGDFGEATFTVKNNPLPSNPKTSYLAAMSILGTVERLNNRIKIG
jgi:aspartate dehydrogenase